MDPFNKNATLTIRMSIRQLEKLHKAAGIESERRDEKVEPSRLLRELAMRKSEIGSLSIQRKLPVSRFPVSGI